MPAAPFGGSQWMRQQGLMRDPQNRTAGLLGEAVGGVLPIVAAAKAPQIARGLLQAGDNLRAPNPMNTATRGQAGAIVYHGSPHRFDKFDSSKIGTGEGAQAYGHGLYFAESPDVARSYKTALEGKIATLDMRALQQHDAGEAAINAAKSMFDMGYSDDAILPVLQRAYKTLQPNQAKLAIQAARPGSLYKVDLPDEHIAKMLDWDKPLSQQSAEIRKFFEPRVAPIRQVMSQPGGAGWGDLAAPQKYDPPGRELLQLLRQDPNKMTAGTVLSGGVGPEVSAALQAQGIPGIRYLDGGSRTAGAGTSNYVVFPGNEGLLNILSRE
jgi:hypothetical protein